MNSKNLVITIFGSTGDLSLKKLFPSLANLYAQNLIPFDVQIIAYGRRDMDSQAFRKYIEGVQVYDTKFLDRIEYVKGEFDNLTSLRQYLNAYDQSAGHISNKLFHLAIPPELYPILITHLGQTFPVQQGSWTKLVIEKPFGEDLTSADTLNKTINEYFTEEQIYNIDHYLGKNAIQNIIPFRFSNIFESIWNSDFIDHITITAKETIGIENRGEYYDKTGALRDVVQNHLLQMLALTTMEKPADLSPHALSKAKTAILENLIPFNPQTIAIDCIRGQYESYRQEKNVSSNSHTETYVALKAHIDNPSWQDVPIFLEAGKKLDTKLASIGIAFKQVTPSLFSVQVPNRITLSIQPEEFISMDIVGRDNVIQTHIEPQQLQYRFSHQNTDIAYEKLLFDCINGDKTNFPGISEIRAAWKYVTEIRSLWEQYIPTFPNYADGAIRPAQAQVLFAET